MPGACKRQHVCTHASDRMVARTRSEAAMKTAQQVSVSTFAKQTSTAHSPNLIVPKKPLTTTNGSKGIQDQSRLHRLLLHGLGLHGAGLHGLSGHLRCRWGTSDLGLWVLLGIRELGSMQLLHRCSFLFEERFFRAPSGDPEIQARKVLPSDSLQILQLLCSCDSSSPAVRIHVATACEHLAKSRGEFNAG